MAFSRQVNKSAGSPVLSLGTRRPDDCAMQDKAHTDTGGPKMRNVRAILKPALLLLAGALALSGCVAYPAPGYYSYGYSAPYYAPYYGPPAYGAVVIGGGRFHGRWR
jgi:hypothetical protein